MQIQQIMSQPAATCRATDTINTAAEQMWNRDCGALPVVDDNGSLVGIITDRDVCMAAYTQGRPLHEIPVATAMARQVFTCQPRQSLEAAEHLMADKQIRRLPVVDGDNRPVGMLSLNDIARHVAATRKQNGMAREVTQTLAAICQPRPLPLVPTQPGSQPAAL